VYKYFHERFVFSESEQVIQAPDDKYYEGILHTRTPLGHGYSTRNVSMWIPKKNTGRQRGGKREMQ
jgi:hypothetical protein